MTTETKLPRLGEMTPEQKRVLIAEAVGECPYRWRFVYQHEEGSDVAYYDSEDEAQKDWNGIYDGPGGYANPIERCVFTKDFTGSLDAMAEAEKALINSTNEFAYQCHLKDISGQPYGYRASAEQRTNAFLLALGLAEKDF